MLNSSRSASPDENNIYRTVERAVSDARRGWVGKDQPPAEIGSQAIVAVRTATLGEFLVKPFPARERILTPWLLTQSLSMIHAYRGVGKTHVAIGVAYAVATGGKFLAWEAERPRRVLYLDGEMPAPALQERFRVLFDADERDFDSAFLTIASPDLQDDCPMPDLATTVGQEAVERVVGDSELIVVDNVSTLVRNTQRENDAESWRDVGEWALRMRQKGRSVLFVHHSGKNGQQRGSSKKEDTLDTVILLKHPPDYSPEQGARFEIHYEKFRNGTGEDAKPLEVALVTGPDGKSAWSCQAVSDSTFDRVVGLYNEGLEQVDIATELELNKSTVSRHVRKAREAGLLTRGAL